MELRIKQLIIKNTCNRLIREKEGFIHLDDSMEEREDLLTTSLKEDEGWTKHLRVDFFMLHP